MTLDQLRGKSLAVDASNTLYQFLALIRRPDGRPFTDSEGHITSHLVGLLMRTTRLIADYDIRPVFVFDGKPAEAKMPTLRSRREFRERSRKEWEKAVRDRDFSKAWSKAVRMDTLTGSMKEDAIRVISMLGIPYVQAPQEGEAQAAHMAMKGDVWAANSRDYDVLLFGSPRLVRYVTISGQEFLPSKRTSRQLIPELIELRRLLESHGITREQLVDLAIMVGTDFNKGIRGVGPKTALRFIKKYGRVEDLPEAIRMKLPANIDELRSIFLNPSVTDEYGTRFTDLDESGLMSFLCGERGFSSKKVELAIHRMQEFYSRERSSLRSWLQHDDSGG